ncbi:hypothetical protein [Streptomyces aureus]|uniref:hypothetical protein n=1 Tax=Streptomyces aureus TaxID=193461 RepID=UPI0033DAF356
MARLKPVSTQLLAEAREEAYFVIACLMASLAPGEHVVRLGVCMDDQPSLSATLPITVEGAGDCDDMVEVDDRFFENFAFLLTCGLAQTLSYGVMYLRSPGNGADGPDAVQAWNLGWGALSELPASVAAELIGEREPAVLFVDASPMASMAKDGHCESVFPPKAYAPQ